jgi:hypothetical protein
MKMLIGLLLATCVPSGNATSELRRRCNVGDTVVEGFRMNPAVGLAQSAASREAAADPHRALLASLGAYQGATLIREYVLANGGFGRQYASDLPLDQAPTAVTMFYADKLLALGWQMLGEPDAAVSCYAKGRQAVWILRAGPTDPGPPSEARSAVEIAAPPAGAKFFFAVEAGPKP